EVEQAIMSHPAVIDVAVVGVPDEKGGERPKAFVVLGKGLHASAEDIVEHTRALLAGYKVPRDIVCPLDLPRTPTGKVLK
ncbi:AMP-binding enzyme, partial [Rhodococcus erythropolis]|uniref:AMP-binding enzyme n=1 Tax=Rhodococcus erythropolis TaxID=1833 RepID=UPI003D0A0B3C